MTPTGDPAPAIPTPRVDAHVHGFPDRLALAVRHHLNRTGRLHAGVLLPAVAHQVRAAGFDAAWLLPYAHKAGVAASVNDWSAAACRRFPWLVAGATFHPADDDLAELVHRALVALRLRVVKLHCAVGAFPPTDPRLAPLWTAAAQLGVPVVIHAGQQSPGETAASELDALVPVLRHHPDLRLVLAHAGYPNTARALELMDAFPNLCADLTPVWDRPIPLGHRELSVFAGRVLFGSDAPNNPVPARDQATRLQALGLDAAAYALLMGGAAARLLRPPARAH
jgi:uncharacterized protein